MTDLTESQQNAILSAISDAVITTDEKGCINYMNPIAEKMTGWSIEEARDHPIDEAFSVMDESGHHHVDPVHHCLKNGEALDMQGHERVLIHRDGASVAIEESLSPIRDSHNIVTGVVVVFRDVSHARTLAAQVSWQAAHDALTGLLNRKSFDSKLEEMLVDARESGNHHALLYLDLDQFKVVNDTCGHIAGDELLKQISKLLHTHIRTNDTLARLGGDEYGIQLLNCPPDIAMRIANQIRQAIKEFRFSWGETAFSIGVSIGVVEVTKQSESVEYVLSAADTACYAAKDGGRNQSYLYRPDDGEAAQRQGEMQWFTRIQSAMEENRLLLYVQPIAPVSDPNSNGHLEVLIRMMDEQGEIIPPGAFIPAAERYGLMSAIDRWVVSKIFELIRKECDALIGGRCQFAINLSGGSLGDAETLAFIKQQLDTYEIPKGMISFEITETSAISNLASANNFIRTLKQAGCHFSLDDFGSGLSSFAYLKNLPVDFLKIDGAFVKDMVDDPIDRAMVESINQIGHVMNLKTIAEFVENDDILACLQEIGVDYAQGYGIAKPMPLLDRYGKLLLTKAACSIRV